VDKFQAVKNNTARLVFGTELLELEDLQRLNMGSWINDEIVNVWRAIMLNRYIKHGNIWIFSSFFFKKLDTWRRLKGNKKRNFFEGVQKHYKQVLLSFIFINLLMTKTDK